MATGRNRDSPRPSSGWASPKTAPTSPESSEANNIDIEREDPPSSPMPSEYEPFTPLDDDDRAEARTAYVPVSPANIRLAAELRWLREALRESDTKLELMRKEADDLRQRVASADDARECARARVDELSFELQAALERAMRAETRAADAMAHAHGSESTTGSTSEGSDPEHDGTPGRSRGGLEDALSPNAHLDRVNRRALLEEEAVLEAREHADRAEELCARLFERARKAEHETTVCRRTMRAELNLVERRAVELDWSVGALRGRAARAEKVAAVCKARLAVQRERAARRSAELPAPSSAGPTHAQNPPGVRESGAALSARAGTPQAEAAAAPGVAGSWRMLAGLSPWAVVMPYRSAAADSTTTEQLLADVGGVD